MYVGTKNCNEEHLWSLHVFAGTSRIARDYRMYLNDRAGGTVDGRGLNSKASKYKGSFDNLR